MWVLCTDPHYRNWIELHTAAAIYGLWSTTYGLRCTVLYSQQFTVKTFQSTAGSTIRGTTPHGTVLYTPNQTFSSSPPPPNGREKPTQPDLDQWLFRTNEDYLSARAVRANAGPFVHNLALPWGLCWFVTDFTSLPILAATALIALIDVRVL